MLYECFGYCKSIHMCSIEHVNLKVYRRQALLWHNRVMHPICIAYFLSQFAYLNNAAIFVSIQLQLSRLSLVH